MSSIWGAFLFALVVVFVLSVCVCVSLRLVTYSWRLQGVRLNWSQISVAHFGRSFSHEDSTFPLTGATTNGSVPLVWLKIRRGKTSSREKGRSPSGVPRPCDCGTGRV